MSTTGDAACDDVQGTISAQRAIDEVDAGGAVTAMLITSSIGAIHEYDRTQFSGWPEPRPGRFGQLVTAMIDLQHAAALAQQELVHDLNAQQLTVNAIHNAL